MLFNIISHIIGYDFNQAIEGHSMVKSQDGSLIVVSGEQGPGGIFNMSFTNTLWKFKCRENPSKCNWSKMSESLVTARDDHVSLMVPSDFCKR
jgi:hypothetical protein